MTYLEEIRGEKLPNNELFLTRGQKRLLSLIMMIGTIIIIIMIFSGLWDKMLPSFGFWTLSGLSVFITCYVMYREIKTGFSDTLLHVTAFMSLLAFLSLMVIHCKP